MNSDEGNLTPEERDEAVKGLMDEIQKTGLLKRKASQNPNYVENSDSDINEEMFEEEEVIEEHVIEMMELEDASDHETRKQTKQKTSKTVLKKDREYNAKIAICEEVRKYPALYQITHRQYANKVDKDAMWEEISLALKKKMGPKMTVKYCRKLWDSLRESTR